MSLLPAFTDWGWWIGSFVMVGIAMYLQEKFKLSFKVYTLLLIATGVIWNLLWDYIHVM